jgi:hypothetical protein
MKTPLIALAVLAISAPISAFAGNTSCETQFSLSCKAVYAGGVAGPSGTAAVQDIESEPFDPSDCEASVVLYTEVGKFVATYVQNYNTVRAWVDSGNKETLLIDDAHMDTSSLIQTSSSTAHFTCKIISE